MFFRGRAVKINKFPQISNKKFFPLSMMFVFYSSSAINACVTLAGAAKTATSTTMSVNPTRV